MTNTQTNNTPNFSKKKLSSRRWLKRFTPRPPATESHRKHNTAPFPIEELPHDVLVEILSYLTWDPLYRFNYREVSPFFAECLEDSRVWKATCQKRFGKILADETVKLYGGDWKKMAFNDNRKGALVTVTPDIMREQDPRRPFRGAQLHRQERYLRVYIDTQGEGNMPHPMNACFLKGTIYMETPIEWNGTSDRGHFKGYLTFQLTGAWFIFWEEKIKCYYESGDDRLECNPLDLSHIEFGIEGRYTSENEFLVPLEEP